MADGYPSGHRILVADDDPSIRQLLGTIVRREGLDVDCVVDATEAIQRIGENEYSVILLDLMMPRADGFAVIDHLRQHPPARKPIVLVITAYADQKFKSTDRVDTLPSRTHLHEFCDLSLPRQRLVARFGHCLLSRIARALFC